MDPSAVLSREPSPAGRGTRGWFPETVTGWFLVALLPGIVAAVWTWALWRLWNDAFHHPPDPGFVRSMAWEAWAMGAAGVLGLVLVLVLFAGWRRAPAVVIALVGPHIVGEVLLNGVTTLLGISMKGHHGIETAWMALSSLVGIPVAYTVLRRRARCSARRAAAVLLLALVVAVWAVVFVHGRLTRGVLSRRDAMGVSGAPAR